MLPLQITLDGFMSYRDSATLNFEGASLWMLAGNNGAGKSSVFDAMRWMLFNRHRGGAQGHEALIHHDKTKLRVAFDLEIASGRFRLMRTLSRGGKSSWQIEKLMESGTEKVPETDMRDGYNRWLDDHIGLSDETFGAAFYLAQGRGDAILSAKPEERYEMLAEIVDLSAFARLHERAKTKAAELENQSRAQRAQFEAAPVVEAQSVLFQREKLADLTLRRDEMQARIAQFSTLMPWANQWQNWRSERLETEKNLQSARELVADAPQIEADAARLVHLEILLPPLENWLAQRTRIQINEVEIEVLSLQLEASQQQHQTLLSAWEVAKTGREAGEDERQQHQAAQLEILTRQNALAPQLSQADALEAGMKTVAELEAQLKPFSSASAREKAALETGIARARSSQIALGTLRRFDRERALWRGVSTQLESAMRRQIEAETAWPDYQNQRENRSSELETARRTASEALKILAAAQARESDAMEALQRFEAVRHEPSCHFCGQKLTPQHAAREETRLQKVREEAQIAAQRAQGARDKAQKASDVAQEAADESQRALNLVQEALQKAVTDAENAQNARRNAFGNASEALRELDLDFAAKFAGAEGAWDETRVDFALQNEFPTPSDLAAVQSQADQLAAREAELAKLAQQLEAKRDLTARWEAARAQIEPLQPLFADAARLELRAEAATLKTRLEATISALKRGEKALEAARAQVKRAEKSLESARAQTELLQSQLAGLGAVREEMARSLSQFEAAHPSLQPLFVGDETTLRHDFTHWNEEKARLQVLDLPAKVQGLEAARQRLSQLENEAARLEKSLNEVPQAAQRAPAELQIESEALRLQLDELEAARRAGELDLGRLERDFAEKKTLQEALLAIETQARQHRTLSDLLGPQQLQRFLLREAENGIVDEANATLDRISGGTLRLELRADDDEVVGARKVAPKVLDVAVHQESSEGQHRAMLPAFLSGSQRFRVAVALALGIGRFATRGQGHSKLESVIIDEGFGSLDKIGRAEMIDELKALGDELKRVILVSHQEEFAEAFPNRYLIEHDGVASTARLMVG